MDQIDRPSIVKLAAAAKSLQSCPTLCDPIDGSPAGSKLIHRFSLNQKSWLDVWGRGRLTKLNFIWKTKGISIALVKQGRPSAAKTKLKNKKKTT